MKGNKKQRKKTMRRLQKAPNVFAKLQMSTSPRCDTPSGSCVNSLLCQHADKCIKPAAVS